MSLNIYTAKCHILHTFQRNFYLRIGQTFPKTGQMVVVHYTGKYLDTINCNVNLKLYFSFAIYLQNIFIVIKI